MNTSIKNIIQKLRPIIFEWKNDPLKRKSIGFKAQDLLEYFPENEYDLIQKDSNGYYHVQYYQLIPILVSKINELEKRIAELEKK